MDLAIRPDDWNPEPGEREYYRSKMTGDRGWLVRREGKDLIRLDRPMEELLRPLHGWQRDEEALLLPASQAAQVAFEADRALCRIYGLHAEARKTWADLKDKERIAFINDGIDDREHPVRSEVYTAIATAMKAYIR